MPCGCCLVSSYQQQEVFDVKYRAKLLPLMVLAACAALQFVQGCTLHFKATDVELDSVGNTTFELNRVALLHGDN